MKRIIRPYAAIDLPPTMDYTGQPDPAFDWYWNNQNPSYPQHGTGAAAPTTAELEAMQRAASLSRAHSPNPLLCKLDLDNSALDPAHTHPFQECMDYRHAHVIGDQQPWMFWENLQDIHIPQTVPLPPGPLVGWFSRAQITPGGIPQMDALQSGWNDFSFVTQIDPSAVTLPVGKQVRLTLSGLGTFSNVMIGPVSTLPYIASAMYPVTWNGGSNSATIVGDAAGGWASPPDPLGEVTSDPVMQAMPAPNGLIVSGYYAPPPTGQTWAAIKWTQAGWTARYKRGNYSTQKDKSGRDWTNMNAASLSVLKIEAYYDGTPPPAPPPAGPLPVGWFFTAQSNPLNAFAVEQNAQTFATQINPSALRLQRGATQIRVYFGGIMYFGAAYIGPVYDPAQPFIATKLWRLTFNSGEVEGFCARALVSDPLPLEFDLTNGIIIQFYKVAQTEQTPSFGGQPYGFYYAYYPPTYAGPGWYTRVVAGKATGALDMSVGGWGDSATTGIGIDKVEVFYDGNTVPNI